MLARAVLRVLRRGVEGGGGFQSAVEAEAGAD